MKDDIFRQAALTRLLDVFGTTAPFSSASVDAIARQLKHGNIVLIDHTVPGEPQLTFVPAKTTK